jgi:hypothetical protein
MTKKKAKSNKPAAKKAAKRKPRRKAKKELNPAEVRKNISMLVESQAKLMAAAVIDSGMKGQLAPVKYLFEVANIFPAPVDGSESTKDEDCLAETLLQRLNLPTTPIVRDDEGEEIVIPAHGVEKRSAEAVEGKTSEDEIAESCEERETISV